MSKNLIIFASLINFKTDKINLIKIINLIKKQVSHINSERI